VQKLTQLEAGMNR